MKTFYLSLAILLAVACGANAQTALVDLSNADNYVLGANSAETALTVVKKASLPVGMPDVGVNTDDVLYLKSNDVAWTWWWTSTFSLNTAPVITNTQNVVSVLVYPMAEAPMQIILKDDMGNWMYVWQQSLTPDQWHTVTIDLSAPQFADRLISSMEFCASAANVEAYFFPYWGQSRTYAARTYVPMFENLTEAANNMYWTYNMGENMGSIVTLPEELKAGLPVQTEEVILVETFNAGDWWWNSRLNFTEFIEVKEETPYLSCFVYSPNYAFNLYVRSDLFLDDLGQEMYVYPNYNELEIKPNEWTEIQLDLTGKVGQSITQFEILVRTANTKLYFYPVWQKKSNGSSINKINVSDDMPFVKDGQILVKEYSNIKLYNATGRLVASTMGTSVPAIDGLNIVVVNGISYKLLNK